MKVISHADWTAEAERLFGKDVGKWKFVCPNCKTVQTAQTLHEAGCKQIEGSIAFSCVGRFDSKQGCNWTLGGLFKIHQTEVEFPDGMKRPVFEFYDAEEAGADETRTGDGDA